MEIEDGRKYCDNVLQGLGLQGSQERALCLPFRGHEREISTHSGILCLAAKVRTAYVAHLAYKQSES